MCRYRLYPTREQEQRLTAYCAHARYVWNLAVEQLSYSTRDRWMPNWNDQSRQLTEVRHANPWMQEFPSVVGQQALRDFRQACLHWWGGTSRRPSWRKQGRDEGFRVAESRGAQVEKLNRRWSQVWVPRLGWVKFRRTRTVPDAKSFRVTRDPAGRWHIAFAVAPAPIPAPGNFEVIGVDRGIAVTLAYSDGTLLHGPKPSPNKAVKRALSRRKHGSKRREKARLRVARLYARDVARRRDFLEKATTDLARRYDLIRIEDLQVPRMVQTARGTVKAPGRNVRQKAGLNQAILTSGWGMFARRLQDKAPQRVEKINPAHTSTTCSACRTRDPKARESQAVFRCRACGHAENADVNAAKNIAAGWAARGAEKSSVSKRRPPRAASPAA